MLSFVALALAFTPPSFLTAVTRRDAILSGAIAAAVPFAAVADGSTSLVTLQKARLSYGQKVLGLVDASPEKILAEKSAISLYVSAVERTKGKKVDPRKSQANDIIKLAAAGDKAGANAALKDLVKSTQLTRYVSDGIVSGSKFVDAIGLPNGVDEIGPAMK